MINFGEWLPDIAVFNNPGATEAKNVVPGIDGYKQLLALQVSSSALDAVCKGAIAAQKSDGVSYNYAGNTSKLYELVDSTWTDRSVGGGYAVAATDYWEFIKWGDKIIAVGGTGVSPQIVTMSTNAFAALGGIPPKARHIAVVRDFVVMGNYDDGGTIYPTRLIWSGLNDETNWTTSAEKQSDYQELQGKGGWIRAIRGGEYGVILQEHSIWKMDYIGPPAVFSFDETLPGVGTPAPNSVVQWGDIIYFLSQTGFEAVEQGISRVQIGRNKVNDYFYSNVEVDNITRTVGALDRENRRIMWIYPATGSTAGLPNAAIIFDIESGRWSRAEFEAEWLYDAFGEGYTIDGLDAVSASIDTLAESLDSRAWMGGAIYVSGFDSVHKSGTFAGSALTATLETGEQKLSINRTNINRVRPEVDGASAITVAPGTRDKQTDTVSWGSAASAERDGGHAMRSDARYHRFRAAITGGFTRAQGITVVEGVPSSGY